MANKVAFVTGASRGIGKSCAVELAEAGFDVVLTARTLAEGDAYEHSSTLKASDLSPLPGSLQSTAELVRKAGSEPLIVRADLLDSASLGSAVATTLERKGRIDVVVHNGRYIGPGHMDLFMDTPIELLRKQMEGNVFATLIINQLVIPSMIKNGGGKIINITSASGYGDPLKPAGGGGWGMGYGISKGAMQRIAGFLQIELQGQGIEAYNVQPGFIATERMAQDMAKFGYDASAGAPPQVVGKVVRYLSTSPDAKKYVVENIEAQFFCAEHGLLPGWSDPVGSDGTGMRHDLAGYNLEQHFARQREAAKVS